jgi:hypothetical protein
VLERPVYFRLASRVCCQVTARPPGRIVISRRPFEGLQIVLGRGLISFYEFDLKARFGFLRCGPSCIREPVLP